MVKFMILLPRNTPGRIIMANGPSSIFHENRLVGPQDFEVAIFMVIIIIWILQTPEGILNTIGKSSIFQKNRPVGPQGYLSGNFRARIRVQGRVKKFHLPLQP